jgi:hypothetical protein
MALLVARAVCPKCSHEEFPVRHVDCFGGLVKQGGQWSCYSCEVNFDGQPNCICDNCGYRFTSMTAKWHGDLADLES